MFDNDLTDKNVEVFMMRMYDNPYCEDMDEYHDDCKRIKYIKRLLNRYEKTGELKERLILNHIIVLYNVFGVMAATRILFFKIDEELWSVMKTFLVFLGDMPVRVEGIRGMTILSSNIPLDSSVADTLRNI